MSAKSLLLSHPSIFNIAIAYPLLHKFHVETISLIAPHPSEVTSEVWVQIRRTIHMNDQGAFYQSLKPNLDNFLMYT